MNAKLFSGAMNELDGKYIEEALCCQKRASGPRWMRWVAAAACFAVVLATACSLWWEPWSRQSAAPPDTPNGVAASHPGGDIAPAASPTRISMDDVFLNELGAPVDGARRWYDPELYENVAWDREAVTAYYGKELTPPYIPDGLRAAPGNGTATIIADMSGRVVEDTVWLGFYHDYYEDGSPKLTEDAAACKGFSIAASRLGLLRDCLYLLPEHEVRASDIGEVSVTFGYRPMPYGPYAPDTHAPSGDYDLYVAEFEQDGIEYQIVAEQMSAEELVKVVSSVICGEAAVIDR